MCDVLKGVPEVVLNILTTLFKNGFINNVIKALMIGSISSK